MSVRAKAGTRICVAVAMAAVTLTGTEAASEPRYDKTLAKAIAEKVAARLGDLRGGFDPAQEPVLLTGPAFTHSIGAAAEQRSQRITRERPARPIPPARLEVRVVYAGTMHAMF